MGSYPADRRIEEAEVLVPTPDGPHVWLWFHNPDGLFAGMNPLVDPFNAEA